jgi:heme ABC exporter ATP-binding subunit CcmA
VSGLKKSFGFKPVLRRIDFTLSQGQRLALLGPNGAGKTTLLRILAGLSKASSGTITISGLDSRQDAQEVRALVGLVAHQAYLYEELSALENLLFFARMYAVPQARERSLSLLEHVGLARRVNERVSTFSRGQVQRLAWARALLHQPQLLLLDEPDTGLDQQGNALMDTLFAEHHERGGSIIFTTHNLERALRLSDRILIIAGGRVAYQHDTEKLTFDELQRAYQEVV